MMTKDEPALIPWAHYQAGRAALWDGKLDGDRADLSLVEHSGIHSPVVDARLLTMNAWIAAVDDRTAEALDLLGAAAVGPEHDRGALDVVWDEAMTGIDVVTLLDATRSEVIAIANSTRNILVRLGAAPYLARLDEALAGTTTASVRPDKSSGCSS